MLFFGFFFNMKILKVLGDWGRGAGGGGGKVKPFLSHIRGKPYFLLTFYQ